MIRTTTKTVRFRRPFCLKGVDRLLPPADYRVMTDEELIEGLSFPAYRRGIDLHLRASAIWIRRRDGDYRSPGSPSSAGTRCDIAQCPLKTFEILWKDTTPMRNILHAKFGAQLAKQSRPSDKVPGISPSPQLPSNSVEDFEGALTKARAAWRASRGRTRTVICNLRIARRP
jgi:hypothetical protein